MCLQELNRKLLRDDILVCDNHCNDDDDDVVYFYDYYNIAVHKCSCCMMMMFMQNDDDTDVQCGKDNNYDIEFSINLITSLRIRGPS